MSQAIFDHKIFMQAALVVAEKAFVKNEVPIGAVIVDSSGKIVARAYNRVEEYGTQLAHAELLAIKKATKKNKDWRLDDFTMYVTLEPCLMCMAAISMHRINRVVYGLSSDRYGFSKNKDIDKSRSCARNINSFELVTGILENESKKILQLFFKNNRKLKRGNL